MLLFVEGSRTIHILDVTRSIHRRTTSHIPTSTTVATTAGHRFEC